MKQMKRKLLSLFLAAAMTASLLPASALAADGDPVPTEPVPAVESILPEESAEADTPESFAPVEESQPVEDETPVEDEAPEDPDAELQAAEAEPRAGGTLYVAQGGTGNGASESSPAGNINNALQSVGTGGTVIVLGDMTCTDAIGGSGIIKGKSVTLSGKPDSPAPTIKLSTSAPPNALLFAEGTNTKLTLENITIDFVHKTGIHGVCFVAEGGELILGDGATLMNCEPRAVNIRKNGTLTMLAGCTITNSKAGVNNTYVGDSHTGVANAGAAVYLCPGGTFNMQGGTISGNTASAGGAGVYGEKGAVFKMSGAPVVKDNVKEAGTASNVYLGEGQVIDLTGGLTGGEINLYVEKMPSKAGEKVQIAKNAKETDLQYLHSDQPTAAGMVYEEGAIYLSYDARSKIDLTAGITDGKKSVTINPALDGYYYSIVDAEGNNVAPTNFNVVNGNGEAATITDTYWAADATGVLTISPLASGYKVVMTDKPSEKEPADLAVTGVPVYYYYVNENAEVEGADGTKSKPYPTVAAAYATVDAGDAVAIILLSDVTLDAGVTMSTAANVTLTSEITSTGGVESKPFTVNRGGSYETELFTVSGGSAQFENVILQGDSAATAALVAVNGAAATLGDGAVLQGNQVTNNSTNAAGAVFVGGNGKLTMRDGAVIRDNEWRYASAVHIFQGSFVMDGGEITQNTAGARSRSYGGAVYVGNSGTVGSFTMNGGSIKDNDALYGAGVYVWDGTATYKAGDLADPVCLNTGKTLTLAEGWTLGGGKKMRIETTEAAPSTGRVIVDGSNASNMLEHVVCNNGDAKVEMGAGATDGKIVINGNGTISIDLQPGTVTNARQEGTSVSYQLGNAVVTGTNAYTFSISVDNGYFKVKKADMPSKVSFYAGLSTGGALNTTAISTSTAYVDLILSSELGASSIDLQNYLRENVVFYRPGEDTQNITVQAENFANVNKTEDGRTVEAFRGHYYEFVPATTMNWDQVKAAAAEKTFNGLKGYLITVTGSAEHNYIYQKFGNNGWMGSYRDGNTWKWATGPETGKIIGTQPAGGKGTTSVMYTNWTPGEPNGKGVPGTFNEGYGQYGYGTGGRWNDLPNRGNCGYIQGYYVEYGGYADDTTKMTTPRATDTRKVEPFKPGELPTLVVGAVTGDTEGAKATVTVSPTQDGWKYAVLDKDGNLVTAEGLIQWQEDTGTGVTSITFEGLEQGAEYSVIAVPEGTSTDELDKLVNRTDIGSVVTPVIPALKPENIERTHGAGAPVTDTITIPGENTKDDRNYAVVDKDTGEIIGWTVGTGTEGNDLTFAGLDPNHTYEVVESGKTESAAAHMFNPGVTVPALVDKDAIKGTGAGEITIFPADPELDYAVVDKAGNVKTDWTAPTDGEVKFTGLTGGEEYTVVTRPKDDTAYNAQTAPGGLPVKAPTAPVTGAKREDSATADKDKITLPSTSVDASTDYALVDDSGHYIKADGTYSETPVWINKTPAGDITWDNLDPNETYHIQSRPKNDTSAIPSDKAVYPQTGTEFSPNSENGKPTGKLDMTAGPLAAGGYEITVDNATLPQNSIVVKDENGTVLTPDNGKYPVSEGGSLVVEGLKPGQSVSVSKDAYGDTVDDVRTPAADASQITGGYDSGATDGDTAASITIRPAVSDVTYAVVDSTGSIVAMGKDGATADADGKTDGSLTLDGLKPGGDYTVVVIPEGTQVPDGDSGKRPITVGDNISSATIGGESATTDIAGTGVDVLLPPASLVDVSAGGVSREEGTGEGTDKIVINPVENGQEYGLVDKSTGETVWKPATDAVDNTLTFDNLDPNREYDVITRVPGTESNPPSLPGAGVTVPPAHTVKPGDVTLGADENGKGAITVTHTAPDTKYAVVDKDGNVVSPVGGDKDGWVTGGGDITFPNLTPGGDYTVVTLPKGDGDQDGTIPGGSDAGSVYPENMKNPAGPTVRLPVVSGEALSGGIITGGDNDGKTFITVQPSDQDQQYAVYDPDTGNVVSEWKNGTGKDGDALRFAPLEPGKEYQIITLPVGAEPPSTNLDKLPNAPIVTPVAPVDPSNVTRESDSDDGDEADKNKNEDKITIVPTVDDMDYSIVDKATGEVVATKPAPGSSGSLTFNDLDPNKEYEVVVTKPGTKPGAISIPAPGAVVKPIGQVELSGIVKDGEGHPVKDAIVTVVVKGTDGVSKTLTAKTDAEGKYIIEADGVAPSAADDNYKVYVSSPAGSVVAEFPVSKVQPQKMGDLTVANPDKSIVGGAVTTVDGKPAGGTVTIKDKADGSDKTSAGTITGITAGGGYVVEGLPEGTYIVETTGNGKSGMTEIKVDANGKVTPNTDGGYKNTNLTAAPGSIVSGKVEGLANGEKATVTVTVPIVDEKGDVIGTKNVTATAVGTGDDATGGYWQIAGVPNGTYPATVTTSTGKTDAKEVAVSGPTTQDFTPTKKDDTGKKNNVVSGIVMDEDGKPVKGAAVTIYDKNGNKVTTTPETVTTGEGGGWSVEGLDPAKGPYTASVDATSGTTGKVNGVAGPFAVDENGKVTGSTNVELPGTVNTSSGAVEADPGKLLTGVVKDEADKPVKGATVVVKDNVGKVIATTTTNSDGAYFVPNVPDNATVTVTTPAGSTGKPSNLGSGGVLNGNATVTKPGDTELIVVGPKGELLPVQIGTATSATAKVTIQGPDSDDNANDKFTIEEGKVSVKDTTTNGKYTVTVEQNGMKVEKEITVSSGKITSGSPLSTGSAAISGKLDYAAGTIPSDAAVSILSPDGSYTWGTSAVNPNTGKFEISDIPDGTYQIKVEVADPDTHTKTTVAGTVTMAGGKPTYSFSGTGTGGASVTASEGTLTVNPATAIQTVINAINSAIKSGDITAVTGAMDSFNALSSEAQKQVSAEKVKDLSNKLTGLLADLKLAASAQNVGVKAETALKDQSGLLVSAEEITAAAANEVKVTLNLKAEDKTDDVNLPVADKNKAEAAAKGAEVAAYYDVSITKKTVVEKVEKVGENEVSRTTVSDTTTPVTKVPVPITITLPIPEGIRDKAYFNVIRVHTKEDGTKEAARIPSTVNAAKTEITFESSLYSTYAIAWSDVKIFGDESDTPENPATNPGTNPGTNSSGGGGGSSAGSATVGKTDGGKVTLSPSSPKEGDQVTITVKPDEGYTLDKLTIKDSKGNEIKYVDNGDGTYTYTQPKGKVTITAEFRKVSGAPHDNGVDRLLIVDDHIAYLQGDPNGNFRPAGDITRAEVAQMFYNLLKDKDVRSDKTFTDVADDAWYAEAVTALAELGIVNGVGGGAFAPGRAISRAEFAAIAARFALRTSGTVKFTDVAESHWAYEAIGMAAYYGWVNGYEDGSFKPDANIARSEAAKMVNTMLGRSADKDYVDKNDASLKRFPDVAETNWAYYQIMEATNAHDFTVNDGVESWEK